MSHPAHDTFFRCFEQMFLWGTVACSAILTLVLAGVPALLLGN